MLLEMLPVIRLRETLWSTFVSYARSSVLKALQDGMERGHLTVKECNECHIFPANDISPSTRSGYINVINESFWVRVYLSHDLGFAEAYMHGDIETNDLKTLLDLWLDNRAALQGLVSVYNHSYVVFSSLAAKYFGQTLSNAKLNVVTGYDCCNDFFKAFLSEEMTYSSALWPESLGGVLGDLNGHRHERDLESAQRHKIHHLLKKARVRPGHRLLEFGSGWGALAIEAAKMGCTVDTLTLSVQQKNLAEERVAAEGLTDRVRVHLMDYRNLPPEFEKAFDAFVSVEMVEAVGIRYLPRFFEILDWALKSDRSAAVITATTQPESRYSEYQATDYARKYQWPNSFCPSATSFVMTAQTATRGKLALESVEDFGVHYPRTLREWGRRLQENWNPETITALLKEQPQLSDESSLRIFRRKWEYMYVYAEVGYARAYTSMHYFTFVRPEYPVEKCD